MMTEWRRSCPIEAPEREPGVFKRPKMEQVGPQPDPADLANRRNTERRMRLATGGRQSTILGSAIRAASTGPTATLTGVQGG